MEQFEIANVQKHIENILSNFRENSLLVSDLEKRDKMVYKIEFHFLEVLMILNNKENNHHTYGFSIVCFSWVLFRQIEWEIDLIMEQTVRRNIKSNRGVSVSWLDE